MTAPATITTPLLARDVRETAGRLVRRLRAEPGPHVAHAGVLGRLDRQGPASVSDLAAGEHMRPQSMAPIVRELEAEGFVTRRPDPADGRRILVELTALGTEALVATRHVAEDWLARTIDGELTAEERDVVAQAMVLLRRVVDA